MSTPMNPTTVNTAQRSPQQLCLQQVSSFVHLSRSSPPFEIVTGRPRKEAVAIAPDGVLLSPGPGRPESSGIICDAIPAFVATNTPVFGVCLGHQAIGHVYGASVVGAPELMHGKTSPIEHEGGGVFAGLASPLTATRYHSLTLDPASVPDVLEVTARSVDGVVMGVRHRDHEVEGVQFHPESILTGLGHDLLKNFLARC